MRARASRAAQRATDTLKQLASSASTHAAQLARWATAPTTRSVAGAFAGGLSIAAGAAMVYAPAGFIIGGAELVFYCLRLIEIPDRPEKER